MEKTGANVSLPKMDMFGAREAKAALHVMIDGKPVAFFNQKFCVVEGEILIPVSCILERLGWKVRWDSDKKVALIRKGNFTLFARVGSNQFVVREAGKEDRLSRKFDTPAHIVNGKIALPISAFLEIGGFNISWDSQFKTVVITTTGFPTMHGNLTIRQIEESGLFETDYYHMIGDARVYSLTREISRKYTMLTVRSLRFLKEDGKYYVEGTLPELGSVLNAGGIKNRLHIWFSHSDNLSGSLGQEISTESPGYGVDGYSNTIPNVGYFKIEVPALVSPRWGNYPAILIEDAIIIVGYQLRGEQLARYSFRGVFGADGTPLIDAKFNKSWVHFGDDSSTEEYFGTGELQLKVEW